MVLLVFNNILVNNYLFLNKKTGNYYGRPM